MFCLSENIGKRFGETYWLAADRVVKLILVKGCRLNGAHTHLYTRHAV